MPGGGKLSRLSLSTRKEAQPEKAPAVRRESVVRSSTQLGVSTSIHAARRTMRRLTTEVLAAVTRLTQADITAVLTMAVSTAVAILADTIKKVL
jgi:hypothetical protein